MRIDPAAFEAIEALVLGFAFAGLLASAFELFSIILRNTVAGRQIERRPLPFVMLATVIACVWSLMSGRLVLDVTQIFVGA